jgi:four helix bundle protein
MSTSINSGQPVGYAESFRDLRVYQKARELSRSVFRLSKGFPAEERYSLTDQIRRASRSIGAQIAEAWAKRRYENHFVSKLTDADAEQMETQHWLGSTLDSNYAPVESLRPLVDLCLEIGRMLNAMIEDAASFCASPNRLREPDAAYFASTTESVLEFRDPNSPTEH